MIPLVCKVRIDRHSGRRLRLWIPLFLLWPFVMAIFVVVEVLVILAAAVLLFIWPREAVKLALALPAVVYLLFQISGLEAEIMEPGMGDVLVQLS